MIDLKPNVDLHGARTELVLGLIVLAEVFREHGVTMTVTAVRDGQHMEKSLHYQGLAADIRLASRYTGRDESNARLLADAKARLGPQFDFILETDHFHLEWDPKTPVAPSA